MTVVPVIPETVAELKMTNIGNPQISPRELFDLYFRQEFDNLSENLIQVLEHFENNTYFNLESDAQYFIDVFVKNFLYLFTQPDYILSDPHAIRFIQFNPTISNLVAISSFKTTDAYLEILKNQTHNFVKFLALYSARNTTKIDRQLLFDANPHFACLWYSHFCELYRSALVHKEAYQNLREHLTYKDDRLTDFYNISDVYFGATYIDESQDRELKNTINQSIKKIHFCRATQIKNTPNPKKIAVITCVWFSRQSVYRTLSKFVQSLLPDYELTLVHLGGIRNDLEIGDFKEVKYVDIENNYLNIDSIRNNDFMVVYYPDIGMSTHSVFLSNLRLAPIQICSTGHPVSTFGSEIDYFISGADVEIAERAEENYSERLILIPGFGAIHNQPDYQIRNIKKTRSEFIINCSWFSHKINYPMLCTLKEIIDKSQKKLLFRFFAGGIESLVQKNNFIPFAKDLESILGKDHFELIPGKPYDEYMALMEEGDIFIESYHFGGSNTVADSLYLRKPTVTFEGNRWYNRIGSQMLRSVGLEELIAKTAEEYTRLTLRLIHDDRYRLKTQDKLKRTDLNKTIFHSDNKKYFRKAIDFLIENHEQLKRENSRKPIRIKY